MEQERHTRKKHRLEKFDYSSTGAYFLTICTSDRQRLFWSDAVGASIARPEDIVLSNYGRVVFDGINRISQIYPTVSVDSYIIMPDHVHLLIRIGCDGNGRAIGLAAARSQNGSSALQNSLPFCRSATPTVGNIVRQFKGYVTKQIGQSIWQKSFYDHVIRNDGDYEETLKYIYENPLRWQYKNKAFEQMM